MDEKKMAGRSRGRARARAVSPTHMVDDSAGNEGENCHSVRGRGGFYRQQEGLLVTKPSHIKNQISDVGRPVPLLANYIRVNLDEGLIINQYHVDFEPNVEASATRRYLLKSQSETFGNAFLFDGMSDLKCLKRIDGDDWTFEGDTRGQRVNVRVRWVAEVSWGCQEMIRFYNTQTRRNLHHLGYVLMGKHFYDRRSEVKIQEHGIAIWKGFLTAVNKYDAGVLMVCDTIYKFLRNETVYQVLRECVRAGPGFHDEARRTLAGAIVMTTYNNKTYKIDDINFGRNPNFRFMRRDSEMSIADYYLQQYQIKIEDLKQPLIECLPSARDRRAGRTEKLLLVPELCCLTGLTDKMRENFQLVKRIGDISRLDPMKRIQALNSFNRSLHQNDAVAEDLSRWSIGYENNLLKIKGKVLPPEKVLMANENVEALQPYNQKSGDFSKEIRGKPLRQAYNISKWILLVSPRDQHLMDDFVGTLKRVCGPMGINLANPRSQVLESDRTGPYVDALKAVPNEAQIVLCIVPNNNKDRYDCIKKICCIEKPVASQVVVSRTISKKQMLMSVCTKIGIQMACKMGSEAWALHIPPKNLMVVGYDTYHDSTLKGKSVGGFVSSTNASLTRWYSRVDYHSNREEMSSNFALRFKDGIRAYRQANNESNPERVIIYRDGVSDGMINHVYQYELKQIKKVIEDLNLPNPPKLAFVIVTKRVNTRFFAQVGPQAFENPSPGTIVDTDVTRPERYDFYLVSQSVRQGTVAPTNYNIIEDETNWQPKNHQQLVYKLCHLYYNWIGTVRVPAPCQYAHKLAFLTGQSLHREPSLTLANTLFYL